MKYAKRYSDPVEKFWSRVKKTRGCWEWTAALTGGTHHYGQMPHNGKVCYAHRVSWEINRGKIPKGLNVLHKCDNPVCVKPSHLFLGTHRENMIDAWKKGRLKQPPRMVGEDNWNSKVNCKIVKRIRSSFNSGSSTLKEISEKFGISKPTASCIVKRITWRHCA